MWKFPGQGSNPSCSCSNTGSFNPLRWAGDRMCTSTTTPATAVGILTHGATVGILGSHFKPELNCKFNKAK